MTTPRVVLVTGAAQGIGAEIVTRVARTGDRVAFTYLTNDERAQDLEGRLSAEGGSVFRLRCDVRERDQVREVVKKVAEKFGPLDILVNNAAAYRQATDLNFERGDFRNQFETNVFGTMQFIHEATERFNPAGGRIINLSSIASEFRYAETLIYSASKAALNVVTETFAVALGPKKITVNAVSPGSTVTATNTWLTEEMRTKIAAQTPLGRAGKASDIVDVVEMLASDSAAWITGQVVRADGGYLLKP
jgi:3-oxoacyl-[acyl-carrier protein] reductase